MKIVPIDGHPHDDTLTAYVSDTLAADRIERFESHIERCSACAARLQTAASFEMLMHEAASEMVVEPVAPRRGLVSWSRNRVGVVSGLWAAAAALMLLIVQHGSIGPGTNANALAELDSGVSMAMTTDDCQPGEPGCSIGLLASIDPLVSVDPMSSWPSWPEAELGRSAWSEPVDGEPCGSGEDGGQLVCPSVSEPFSG